MSKQNKWAGNMGKVASGGSSPSGNNTYKSAPRAGAAPKSSSSKGDNIVTNRIGLSGQNNAVIPDGSSSHNSINAFTRGIKSRGPYGGPAFSSFNNSKQHMQKSDTGANSKFKTPSK